MNMEILLYAPKKIRQFINLPLEVILAIEFLLTMANYKKMSGVYY